MKNILTSFPSQFDQGIQSAQGTKTDGTFNSVVFAGMGGSALAGDIFSNWFKPKFPFFVNRSYNLPPQANEETLVICCSYSGNTEECISTYKNAIEKGMKVVAISSGGKLKELCEKNNTPCAIIPDKCMPRLALGYMFGALCVILNKNGLIEDIAPQIKEMAEDLSASQENAQEIAKKINGRTVLVYSSHELKSLGYIWKASFNENAKIPSFANCFPELNHNELEMSGGNMMALILRDTDDLPQIKKRMDLTKNLFEKKGIETKIIDLEGKTLLKRIFSSIILGNWISYFLALETGVQPESTETIEEFKKELE